MSNYESGHAKNAANFTWLREEVEGFGATYNPAPLDIRLTNLLAVEADIKVAMDTLAARLADYKDAVNIRQKAFEDLEKLCARIMGEAVATGADKKIRADLRSLVRKIRGKRAKPIKEEEIPPAEPFTEGKAPESDPASKLKKSASHASYDYQNSHFVQIVALLGKIQGYAPNEPDMSIAGLSARATDLLNKTKTVYQTTAAVESAREMRDRLLYRKGTGAVSLALKVRNYVKATFGNWSSQYNSVAQIVFKGEKYVGL